MIPKCLVWVGHKMKCITWCDKITNENNIEPNGIFHSNWWWIQFGPKFLFLCQGIKAHENHKLFGNLLSVDTFVRNVCERVFVNFFMGGKNVCAKVFESSKIFKSSISFFKAPSCSRAKEFVRVLKLFNEKISIGGFN